MRSSCSAAFQLGVSRQAGHAARMKPASMPVASAPERCDETDRLLLAKGLREFAESFVSVGKPSGASRT